MRDRGVAASLSVQPPKTSIAWSDQHPAQRAGQPCISLPFTAPSLIQMRARRSRQGGLEMLLSNPSGGRGLYVSSWSALRRYASPSLHDIVLAERIEANAALDIPLSTASIRTLAIEVAAAGHAGRKLAQAARRAQRAEAGRQQKMQAHFVLCLARAILPNDTRIGLLDVATGDGLADTDWLHNAACHLAPHFGGRQPWQGADLAKAVTELAELAAALGLGSDDDTAPTRRTQRLLAGARSLRTHGTGPGASRVAEAIDLLLEKADAACSRAHRACADPPALLVAWRADPAATAGMLQECTHLLDGCDRMCLLPDGGEEQARFAQALLLEKETASTVASAAVSGTARQAVPSLDTAALRLRELRLLDPDIDLDQILEVR